MTGQSSNDVESGGDPRVLFFGCWGHSGHYLWTPAGALADDFQTRQIDGPLCPPSSWGNTEGNVRWGNVEDPRGNVWTFVSFWDRSVDRRDGSHSTYLIEGVFPKDEALDLARRAFPRVWARYQFTVV